MLTMNDVSRVFLEEHLPEALKAEEVNEALDMLFDFIDEFGFSPPEYENYNDLGREAQKVYDDIYLSNE